jgi:UDP-glucose 4-epimerase
MILARIRVDYAMKANNGYVLVTGGAGFIGSHLVEKLSSFGYRVRVIDNLYTGKLSNLGFDLLDCRSVEFIEGDIRDSGLVEKCCADAEAVIHLAAQTSVPFSMQNPEFNNDVNVKGTLNLLNSSSEANVKRFLFISSCAVYGEPAYLPIDEKHPTNPISPYAESKLAAEKECLRLNDEGAFESVVFRFFNVYGPRQGLSEYSGVITKFIDRIKQKLPLIVYGDGSQTRDFVYVNDIVNAIVLALENKKAPGNIFNVGTGKEVPLQELAKTMLSLTGAMLQIVNVDPRIGDIKHSYADITKASQLLGYKPEFSLKEGLEALLCENNILAKP